MLNSADRRAIERPPLPHPLSFAQNTWKKKITKISEEKRKHKSRQLHNIKADMIEVRLWIECFPREQ